MVEWRRLRLYHKSDAKNGSNPTVPACCKTYVLMSEMRFPGILIHKPVERSTPNRKVLKTLSVKAVSSLSLHWLQDWSASLAFWFTNPLHFQHQTGKLKKKKKKWQSKQFLHFHDTDRKTPWATLKWQQTETVDKITKEVNSHQLIKRDTTRETWIAYTIYQLPDKAAVLPTGSTNYVARK